MHNDSVVIEHDYNTPISLVWRAITEKDFMEKWFFDIAEFELIEGYKFRFEGGEEKKRYVHLCEIVEIVDQKKLRYSWAYEGHEGLSYVTFDLIEIDTGTKVKLTQEGVTSFNNPDLTREKFMEGWTYLIQTSLKEFLQEGKALRYW